MLKFYTIRAKQISEIALSDTIKNGLKLARLNINYQYLLCATDTQQELPLQGRKQFCLRSTALWDTDDSKVLLGNSERGGEDADDSEAEARPGT